MWETFTEWWDNRRQIKIRKYFSCIQYTFCSIPVFFFLNKALHIFSYLSPYRNSFHFIFTIIFHLSQRDHISNWIFLFFFFSFNYDRLRKGGEKECVADKLMTEWMSVKCHTYRLQMIFGAGNPSARQVMFIFWFSRTATDDGVLSMSKIFGGTMKI